VIDIDDLANVVVLHHHFLGLDQRLFTTYIQGVEAGAEIAADRLVTKA
jgi:hypothetical protein